MNTPEINPYAPPAASLQPIEDDFVYPPASNGKRFLNLILDRFMIVGFAMAIGAVLGVLESLGLIHGVVDSFAKLSRLEDYLITGMLSIIYYTGMEFLFGRSMGKLITGTKVLTEAGGRPSFIAVLGRTLVRFVPFEPFSFLGTNSGWHDRWSGTQVVDVRVGKQAPISPNLRRFYR
ncbi:MAG: RDD family protein [Verrucomicrobiaceae bacterium]